jgi:hypothetical protein
MQYNKPTFVESRFRFATLTIGVPVDDFERALRRLREVGLRVLDESLTGQDVTDGYVDLNSQLENLKATQDRIRTFLDRAETAEEALMVNQQLSQVEAQIAQIEGRMNYLFDCAAYSTISVTLEPELPELGPTPTPTTWSPGATASQASSTLMDILRDLVDIGIWFAIVVLPLVGIPVILIYVIIRLARQRKTGSRTDEKHAAG